MANSFSAHLNHALKLLFAWSENLFNKWRLQNKDFTIICATCAGGVITHKLGKQFMSPTVNLFFAEKDVPKLVSDLRWYMTQELVPLHDNTCPFPKALCGDIEITFNHAKSFEEAKSIWDRRKKRINYDNIWVIGSDTKMSYGDIVKFSEMPCKGKIMFTAKEYPEFDFCLPFLEYKEEGKLSVGQYMSHHSRVLDRFIYERYFDYTSWLNGNSPKHSLLYRLLYWF